MAVGVFTRLPLSHACSVVIWEDSSTNIWYSSPIPLCVLGSLRHSLSSLVCHQRIHSLLPGRSRYGSWTPHLSHDPPHACGTPDAAGVATVSPPSRQDSARRGRIILLVADGVPIAHVAATVGISRRHVYKWAQRFLKEGLQGLTAQPRHDRRSSMPWQAMDVEAHHRLAH